MLLFKNHRSSFALCLLLILDVFFGMRFLVSHSLDQLFVFLICIGIINVKVLVFPQLISARLKPAEKEFRNASFLALKVLLLAVFAAVVLEAITVFGAPASHIACFSDWSKKRFLFFFFLVFGAIEAYIWNVETINACLHSLSTRKILSFNKNNAVYLIPSALFFVASAFFAMGRLSAVGYFIATAVVILAVLIGYFAGHLRNFAALFFTLALISGSVLIFAVPLTTGLSPDDQIHYINALDSSYVFGPQRSESEIKFSEVAIRRAMGEPATSISSFSVKENSRLFDEFNSSYSTDLKEGRAFLDREGEPLFLLNHVGYSASAIGLWIGRALKLNFGSLILLSKFLNLFVYCSVITAAIIVAPTKKSLFAFVGLLPSSIMLAANYSYDSWLISFVMLGFAYYLRFAWGSESDFTKSNIVCCFIFTFLGLAVKAVYFPLVGLYFIVPRKRFNSASERRLYYSSVFALGLLTFASFALPFLATSGAGASDLRGGSDVDSGKQLAFILDDPLRYCSIILRFFSTIYLNPITSSGYTFNYFYLGSLEGLIEPSILRDAIQCFPAVCLVILGLTSGDSVSARFAGILTNLWSAFLFLFALFLVATALYISYTPVGCLTVNGCQGRYILPTLVPSLSLILNNSKFKFAVLKFYNEFWLVLSLCMTCICTVLLVGFRY